MRPIPTSIVILGLVLAYFDYLVVPMILVSSRGWGANIAALSCGVIGAQVALVAIWGVFSSASFMRRLGICTAMGMLFYGCFATGLVATNFVEDGDIPLEIILILLTICPLVFFAVQLPLWVARLWLSWEIADLAQPAVGSYLQPTRIKDFILGTATACVALSFVRLGPLMLPGKTPVNEVLIVFAGISGAAAVASLITLPPFVLCTLGTRYEAGRAIGMATWFVAIVTILAIILSFVRGFPMARLQACILATSSFAGVVCACLLIVRSYGYRLRWRGRGRR